MPGGYRSMSGKYAFISYGLKVIFFINIRFNIFFCPLQQFQRKEAGMAFVHMIFLNIFITNGFDCSQTPYTKNYFLAKAIPLVASVKKTGEAAVVFGIFRKIGVQKVNRHGSAGRTLYNIFPNLDFDSPCLNIYSYFYWQEG